MYHLPKSSMFAIMNLRKVYTDTQIALENIFGDAESVNMTAMLFEHLFNVKRADVIRHPDHMLDASQMGSLDQCMNQLKQQMPIQYVLGHAWFYQLRFKVNHHVLIPRPETEQLADMVIEECKSNRSSRIIDIGTGSGCIPVAVKKNITEAHVTGIDVSKDALDVARKNARLHDAEIEFLMLDFLNEREWESLPRYHIIVSNPPYIPQAEKLSMDINVADYEPSLALFVPDEDPLIFYKKICMFGKTKLHPKGVIFLETHESMAKETAAVFSSNDYEATVIKDIFGKERFVKATHH